MENVQNFEKRHYSASKRQKNSWLALARCIFFFSFSDQTNLHDFLKDVMRSNVGCISV